MLLYINYELMMETNTIIFAEKITKNKGSRRITNYKQNRIMKHTIKFPILLLSILAISFFISSCEKKNDDPNTSNNPNLDPDPDPQSEHCFDFNDLSSLLSEARYSQFINEDIGWMVAHDVNTSNRALFRTVDGGANWELINDDINVAMGGIPVPILKFVSPTNGFKLSLVSLQYVVSYTTDGGVTWDNYENPNTNDFFQWTALASNSQETVFINDVSTVMVVNNTTMEVTNVVDMPDFLFLDSYHLWGADFHFSESGVITCVLYGGDNVNNYIAQSSDYGASWTFPKTIANEYVKTMSWPSDQVGYINIGTK